MPASFERILFEDVPGLAYYPWFVDSERQAALKRFIDGFDESSWVPDFKRRKLCFGYRYDYARRSITASLDQLPLALKELALDLCVSEVMSSMADQAIVNEYRPGQGISRHIDAACFGPEIVSVSLGSSCVMRFRKRRGGPGPALDLLLEPGSVVLMAGLARASFTHEIPGRLKDVIGGNVHVRGTRLSVTFRTVISAADHTTRT